jgi:hypothetical protein
MSGGAMLAGALLASLTAMGLSRKLFGPKVVEQHLVPHRTDIGIATFFSIGWSLATHFSLIDPMWGPGGAQHGYPCVLVQIGYLSSLVDRRDFGARLGLLALNWFLLALAVSSTAGTVALETLSLWVVKLRVRPAGSSRTRTRIDATERRRTSSPSRAIPKNGSLKGSKGSKSGGGKAKNHKGMNKGGRR